MINVIGVLSFAALLISCEGNTDRVRQIRNESSHSINVNASGTNVSNYDKSIAAGETEILFIGNQLGGSDYVEEPANGITTLIIVNSLGDTCTKDFSIKENWDIHVEQRKKVPSDWQHEYTFIVNDSDF